MKKTELEEANWNNSFKRGMEEGKKQALEEVEKMIDEFRSKHIHPNQPKLDYYDKWQSSGCNHCLINQKIKQIKSQIKKQLGENK